MKENEFKKGIEDIKNIKLQSTDKSRILKSILDSAPISPYAPKRSFWMVFMRQSYISNVWAALFILFTIGGITVYSAERSLPGDKLYLVKVGFSEPIRDLINIAPENKAEWESVKAARRLDEAADMVIKGQLNEKIRSDLETRFNKHADAFNDSVVNIASGTPKLDLIELEFEKNISARAEVLESLGKEDEKDKTESSQKESSEKNEIKKKNEESRKESKKLENAVSDKLKERKESRKSKEETKK